MALPADPKKLYYGAYDRLGRDLTFAKQTSDEWMPYALRDVEEQTYTPYERTEW